MVRNCSKTVKVNFIMAVKYCLSGCLRATSSAHHGLACLEETAAYDAICDWGSGGGGDFYTLQDVSENDRTEEAHNITQ